MKQLVSISMMGVCWLMLSPAWASESALGLLERMQNAALTLSYTGKLVYQRDGNLITYQVTYSTLNGGQESVVHLESRSDEDANTTNTAATDEGKTFSVQTYSKLQPQTQKAYSFDLGTQERVASIDCQVVVARPKDTMRYLHRYCIDAKTGMLLKYSVMDRNKKIVEQMVFTDFTQPPRTVEAVPPEKSPLAPSSTSTPPATRDQWSFTELPLGFQKIKEIKLSDQRTQIVISDGMISISIFVDTTANSEQLAQEVTYSGAMQILTREVDTYMITAMGEVPESTLKTILNALKHHSQR